MHYTFLTLTERCRIALGLATATIVQSYQPGDTYAHTSTDRMPSDASGEATLGAEDHYMKVRLVPSIKRPGIRHNSAHRITVCCDQCGSWVPSGRYMQHVGSAKCRKIGEAFAATFDSPAYLVSVMRALEGTRDVETIDLRVQLQWINEANDGPCAQRETDRMFAALATRDPFVAAGRWENEGKTSRNMPACEVGGFLRFMGHGV